MGLKTRNGNLLVKDGKLLTECSCCGEAATNCSADCPSATSYTVSGLDIGTGTWNDDATSEWDGVLPVSDPPQDYCLYIAGFGGGIGTNGYLLDVRRLLRGNDEVGCFWEFHTQPFHPDSLIGAGTIIWRKRTGDTPAGTYTLEEDNAANRTTAAGNTLTVS